MHRADEKKSRAVQAVVSVLAVILVLGWEAVVAGTGPL
jgi:hypothetical protein